MVTLLCAPCILRHLVGTSSPGQLEKPTHLVLPCDFPQCLCKGDGEKLKIDLFVKHVLTAQ